MDIHHHHQEHPHSVESGEQHEKKPVLTKMKEKVKRIKNTISKKRHGHGEDEHEHQQEHYNEVISEEEEEEEGYEEEEEPEVHGAPMYESAATKNLVGSRDENLGAGKVNLGENLGDVMAMPAAVPKSGFESDESRLMYPSVAGTTAGEKQNMVRGRDENLGSERVSLRTKAGSLEDCCAAPKYSIREPASATQTPASNPSTVYQSTAARNLVSGHQDENLGPGNLSLGEAMEMPVEDPAVQKNRGWSDGDESLYPFSAVNNASEKQAIGPKEASFGATVGSLEEDTAAPKVSTRIPAVATQQSHASCDSYPSTGGGDEVGESPLLTSFEAMSVSDKPKGQPDVLDSPATGTHDQFSPEKPQQEKMEEETEQGNTSSYTDKITSTAVATKDAAVSAAVGSTEYGKKIASTVYDKVSGAGTAIMGKGTAEPKEEEETKPAQSGDQPDKGGVSVKEYFVGKLRPGDEDRALSEVISDTNKQQVSGADEAAKGSSSEESGGKGLVDKIKGAVTSWIGAGSYGSGPRASPTTDTSMKGETTTTGTVESRNLGEKMQ